MKGPLYMAIEKKVFSIHNLLVKSKPGQIQDKLKPMRLIITDESSKHARHAAMRGSNLKETHFSVEIISDLFEGKVRFLKATLCLQGLLSSSIESSAKTS